MSLQTGSNLGPYQVQSLLGEGGMGAVYRARDTRLGRDVAIKVITNVTLGDRDRIARFQQEARTAGMLNHPNLLTIFDVGIDEQGYPYIVSELLEGETLSSRLERGPLAPRRAMDAALQMAEGLAAAHEKGIVHRDLKPDNVFLARDGRLKILDFGIAKLTRAEGDGPSISPTATEPGVVLGTVGYMSPEQIRGEVIDHRSDIFALGTILYEMLAGVRAFQRNGSIETLSAILREEPRELADILPSVPAPLERLVRRCLEKDRDLRFQSARDLAFHLQTLSTLAQPLTRGGTAQPPPPSPSHAPTVRTVEPAVKTNAPTVRRPPPAPVVSKPRRRVSPLLLTFFYLASVGGAAYAAWSWNQRDAAAAEEPHFDRITFRRGDVRSARFSPDGETIVYSAAWDGQPSETFIATRHAPESRPLGVPNSEILAVSRSAELAILIRRDRLTGLGTLARVPVAGGLPREVAENVITADWSPDGNSLAIIRQHGETRRVEYPIGVVRYESPRQLSAVRVSPDGRRLAIIERSQGQFEIAIIAEGTPTTIARGWARGATGLAWSPDGAEIWMSGTSTAAPPALYAVNVESGTSRLVTRLTGSLRVFDISRHGEALLSNGTWRAALVWKPPSLTEVTDSPETQSVAAETEIEIEASWFDWSMLADLSPDGRTILFSETREGGGVNSSVFLRRDGDASPIRLGEGVGNALSPDGKWALAYKDATLMLIPTGSGQPRELKIAGAFDPGAVWLPDSRRAVLTGVVGDGGYRLHVIDTLDETSRAISPDGIWGGGTRAFVVSPDGTSVAAMTADETITIYPIEGGEARQLTGELKGEIPIQWVADGRALLVYKPTELPAQVFRITLADGSRELWKEFRPLDPAGVYRIAPVLVTPDERAYAYNAMRVMSDLYVARGLR